MGDNVTALKNLAVAIGCVDNVEAVTGDTIAEIIQFIADNYPTTAA